MSAEAVLAANDAFYAAFNARDIAAMDALWAQSTPVACIHPGWNALEGRDQVMESWRAILGNADQARIFTGAATVYMLDQGAYVLCRELVDGAAMAATNVFVQEQGEWRLVHHHASPVAG